MRRRADPAEAAALPDIPCACASARRVSRELTRLYDAHLRPFGLESTQFLLLSVLAEAGPLPAAAIGDRFGFDKSTLSRNLARLRDRGWIADAARGDGRERPFQVTAAGATRLTAAAPAWRRAQQALRRSLGEEEWAGLWDGFRRLNQAARLATRP